MYPNCVCMIFPMNFVYLNMFSTDNHYLHVIVVHCIYCIMPKHNYNCFIILHIFIDHTCMCITCFTGDLVQSTF